MKLLVSRRLFILLLAFPLAVSIWGKTIHGTILDMHGEPVVGATIVEQNTSNGTVADLDGQFTMEVEDGKTIVVSYVGYRSQHVAITSRQTTYTITLQEDIEALGSDDSVMKIARERLNYVLDGEIIYINGCE